MEQKSTAAQTILASDCTIKGEVHFAGPARIAGHIEGEIHAEDLLEIAADAQVEANITAAVVEVQGTVKGNISASRSCRLGSTARVTGELRAANLSISEGACFVGQVFVGGASEPEETQQEELSVTEMPMPVQPKEEIPTLSFPNRIAQLTVTEEVTEVKEPVAAAPVATVRIMTQNVQQTMNRGARIIKAR